MNRQLSKDHENDVIVHLDEFDASGSLRSLPSSQDIQEDQIIESNQKHQYTNSVQQDQVQLNEFQSDLNLQYAKDEDKFMGTWQNERYQVQRSFLSTKTKNVKLYYSVFTPINRDAIASIVFVHGFGEHSGRYIHLADYFASNGFKTFLYDQRGFGYSGGIRGDASVAEMHEDLESVILTIDRSLPVFIYCHSLGSAVVLRYNSYQMFKFLFIQSITQSTGHHFNECVFTSSKKIQLAQTTNTKIAQLFFEGYTDQQLHKFISLQQKQLPYPKGSVGSSNLAVYEHKNGLQYNDSHRVYKKCLSRVLFYQYLSFNVPIFLIHGKEDKVSHHINSIDFYRLIKSKEKTLKIFQNGYHELQHDVECDRLKQIVVTWCNKMCLRDRRIAFFRELNYGIVYQRKGSKLKGRMHILFFIISYVFLKRTSLYMKTMTKLLIIILPQILTLILLK